jgi:hypothetical protein
MALTSPGVQVSVVDESFYTPAEPGTVPMIFVATAENKTNGAGTGIAPGTTAANAGKPYLLTSQRDLTETFGDPIFYTDNNNNPIHAGELNEYGLQAAYSLLGVSNRAWVVRADIDLGALQATADAPAGDPDDGAYWVDTGTTSFGIFEWNGAAATTAGGQSFSAQTPTIITDADKLSGGAPKGSVGAIGDYAIVAGQDTTYTVYNKNYLGNWVKVGSDDWVGSTPSVIGTKAVTTGLLDTDTFLIDVSGTDYTITAAASGGASTTLDAIVSNGNTVLAATGVSLANIDDQLAIINDGSVASTFEVKAGNNDLEGTVGITIGDYAVPKLAIAPHTSVPQFKTTGSDTRPTGSVWIKTTEPNGGARWRINTWNADTELWDLVSAPIYATNEAALAALDAAGGGVNLAIGDLYVQSNWTEAASPLAEFKVFRRSASGASSLTTSAIVAQLDSDAVDFTLAETVAGSSTLSSRQITFTGAGTAADADTLADEINSAGFTNIVASVDANDKVTISHKLGGDIEITDTSGDLADIGITADRVSNWSVLDTFTASSDAPTSTTADGTLWYSSVVDEVDIMVHDGSTWRGYNEIHASASITTAATEPSSPTDQDIWVSTADLENYPTIYRYNGGTTQWDLLDKSDQTTEDGVLFADARWNTDGSADEATIAELLDSGFLDPDAPDPALYPQGMLLWNMRRSGFNVKKFVRNYIDTTADNPRMGDVSMSAYGTDRWVTESANQEDGSGSFGRHAQRKVVVQQLQAMVNSNDDIRDDESRIFNLMATPGYPELIGEMISLNYDRGLSAFIVGDSPARLSSDATSLNEWGTNVALAVEDNDDGLVSRDEYFGVFYPWGFTSDNAGNNVVVPPSHMMLRTIALSDQVSYPWFAPAGTRRGGITNATATGYIDAEGEFVSVALNEGQRDTLYTSNINPITFINGAGLVNYGQKTRARGASSLDRINVARLVIYLRSQLNKLAKPYIFEPNDKITRDQIKQAAESLCLELVGARALYDFLVVCDESNNTPARIDRNELYLDIAIEPVKAVEFVYIPLRLKNTGEIAGL